MHLNGVTDDFIEEFCGDERPEQDDHGGVQNSADGGDAGGGQRGDRQREETKTQTCRNARQAAPTKSRRC